MSYINKELKPHPQYNEETCPTNSPYVASPHIPLFDGIEILNVLLGDDQIVRPEDLASEKSSRTCLKKISNAI